ncbi:MAG: ferric reductase-like transmembrane domain-containing protein [Thermoplasmatota archaeon]
MARRQTLLLLAVIAVVAQAANPINSEPTNLAESECYRCHEQGGGSFGPPLQAMYFVTPPEDLELAVGTPFLYEIQVQNGWNAQLMDIEATMDLSEAPSFGFSSGQEPYKRGYDGTLAVEANLEERVVQLDIDVPLGVTDLLVQLRPATTDSPLAPDLALRVWPGTASRDGDPVTADSETAGGTERYHAKGANTLADLGYGKWAIEVVEENPLLSPSGILAQDFSVDVQGWFNVTGERQKRVSSPEVLEGQDVSDSLFAPIAWTLLAENEPGDEIVRITVNATAFYEHPGTTSEGYDIWRYTQTVEIPVQGGSVTGGDEITFVNDGVPKTPTDSGVVIPWDRIGEIMGYFSTFLILVSVYTGGMFGKATRRHQNKLFGNAKRRIAFHNFLSYGIILMAVAHTVLFLLEPGYPWTLGLIWGGVAILCMLGLGVTGAMQVPMIRKWNFGTWRWWHFGLAIAVIVFTIVHILLDGANFTEIADAIGWKDPLAGL